MWRSDQVAIALAEMSNSRSQGCRVRRHSGAWLIAAENRPGAIAVITPTKPGQVAL